jgi:hypothetical protein
MSTNLNLLCLKLAWQEFKGLFLPHTNCKMRANVGSCHIRWEQVTQRLIPVEKYPKAEREVIVTFDEPKRPAGIDDRHLADLALRDVNRAMLNFQDVKQFPFHLARVTANSNIVLTAAGNVRGVVYTDYVNIIADALKAYGACTAKVHEKWSKFLVRGVPTWLDPEGIRQDIELKYPGIRRSPRRPDGWYRLPVARGQQRPRWSSRFWVRCPGPLTPR